MTLYSKCRRFDEVLFRVIEAATGILLVVMFIVIMAGVIFRYTLDRPLPWTEELAKYVTFYMVLIGSAAAIREKRHPSLTFIVRKFPLHFNRIWNFLVDTLVFFVLIIVFIEGYRMAADERTWMTPVLRMSFFWVYLALPIGAFLMIVQIAAKYIFDRKALDRNVEDVYTSEEG